jgi:ribosomal RNA-processing protein 12
MLNQRKDHKSHFKSKIRHILERLIRKFSLEAVEGFVPEADAKLITNIRKRRDRIKKKKAEQRRANNDSDDDDDFEEDPTKAAIKNRKLVQSKQKEFEDALHDSESELSGSDNDDNYIPEEFRDAVKPMVSTISV